MIESSYRVKVDEGWEFIIIGNDKETVMQKLGDYLDVLLVEDGYFTRASEAKENIKKNEYTIEEYVGFVVR